MMDADFIFQVREAWKLPQKYAARYEEILDEYGFIGASPYAEDVDQTVGLLKCKPDTSC